MRVAKERVIYDNYDLWKNYSDEDLRTEFGEQDATDEMLEELRYILDEEDWTTTFNELKFFFDGKTVGFFGEVGRWDGVYKAGQIGDFEDLFYKATEDCAYIKFYDENGHLYLTCSHHDGTCHFEIKILTEKGDDYFERWQYAWDDRTEEYCHNQIYKRYSLIPRFVEKEWGCKAREYEPSTKEILKRKLANAATSFYS